VGRRGGDALSSGGDLWALKQLAQATCLQSWMFSVLRPSKPGPMLEIGAGIGTFSRLLLEAGAAPLVLIEPEDACAAELRRLFAGDARVEVAKELLPDAEAVKARPGYFTYALAQNVLEHIEDDVASLAAVVDALEPGGELAVLVPAHPFLHGRLDEDFGHFRRYTRRRVRALICDAGAELTGLRSFNALGVPGWWLAGRTERLGITEGSLRVFEALLRYWRPVEDALRPPIGLSLVARARKPVGAA
jgi:SAM-dependent methyltransferase